MNKYHKLVHYLRRLQEWTVKVVEDKVHRVPTNYKFKAAKMFKYLDSVIAAAERGELCAVDAALSVIKLCNEGSLPEYIFCYPLLDCVNSLNEAINNERIEYDNRRPEVVEILRLAQEIEGAYYKGESRNESLETAIETVKEEGSKKTMKEENQESVADKTHAISRSVNAIVTLPESPQDRKSIPLYRGLFCYFPDALVAVAKQSYIGNMQHHPDKPLHWDRNKSMDHEDALLRHLIEGDYEKVAWRALAMLQLKIEGEQNNNQK